MKIAIIMKKEDANMRVKDIYPYIINRRVEITKNGKLLSMLFQIDGKRVEQPEKSYHEVADCKSYTFTLPLAV